MSYDGIGDGYQRWPFSAADGAGTDVLHAERFLTGERAAPLAVVDPVPPADDLGPDELTLTTGRVLQHFNSGALSRRSERLMAMRGEDVLQVHPADAADRGIEDGDRVTVSNDRGSVEATADVTPAVREGVTFCTFHYADPLANDLTGDALDPEAGIPEFKHSAVAVEPAAEGDAAGAD
jgi:formate dehydrogenase major subunit